MKLLVAMICNSERVDLGFYLEPQPAKISYSMPFSPDEAKKFSRVLEVLQALKRNNALSSVEELKKLFIAELKEAGVAVLPHPCEAFVFIQGNKWLDIF